MEKGVISRLSGIVTLSKILKEEKACCYDKFVVILLNMEAIEELKRLLSSSGKSYAESYFDYFKRITEILMNNCVVSKGDNRYEIVEIEFYLFTSDHQDVITYPRKLSAGKWFFHQSGVDLTFRSDEKQFGGILIRGIRNIGTGKLTLGPQNCVNLLWDNADAFRINKDEYPTIVEYPEKLDENIRSFPRWISVNDEKKAEKISYWSNRILEKNYPIDKDSDKTNIVFTSPYRFIKYALIDSIPQGWSGYSAKPRVE